MIVRRLASIACAALLALLAACASRTVRVAAPAVPPPSLTATRGQLLERYQNQADGVHSLNAAVRLNAETGSAYSGVIKNYHQITALVAAERPAWLRIVGQAPVVGTDIFDMVSDGRTFHMYIPSKKRFLEGPANGGGATKNSIENLRPQPLFDALIWEKIPSDATVVMEEEDQNQPPLRDYVLTVLRHAGDGFEIDRRIWFNRADLRVARIEIFGTGGRLDSDISYGDWHEEPGSPAFPWQIALWRPRDEYRLEIDITRIALNPEIPVDRFTLGQPPDTERIEVGQGAGGRP